jgi:NitT/TauT family transport system substrate-binding protein
MPMTQTRRRFLTTLSMAGTASLVHAPRSLAAEEGLETTSLRLFKYPGICVAPQHIAEELLRAEGFTEIRYVPEDPARRPEALARAKVDFGLDFATSYVSAIDRGDAITILSGLHVGCFELRGKAGIRGIGDLKGKNVGVRGLGESEHLFLAVMAAQVGIDPFLAFPPESQDLRARQIGNVVVNSAIDRPWSQYFCCMLAGNRDYVRQHPVATKRVLRAT